MQHKSTPNMKLVYNMNYGRDNHPKRISTSKIDNDEKLQ